MIDLNTLIFYLVKVYMERMPPEMMSAILSKLESIELAQVASTNKTFNSAAEHILKQRYKKMYGKLPPSKYNINQIAKLISPAQLVPKSVEVFLGARPEIDIRPSLENTHQPIIIGDGQITVETPVESLQYDGVVLLQIDMREYEGYLSIEDFIELLYKAVEDEFINRLGPGVNFLSSITREYLNGTKFIYNVLREDNGIFILDVTD